MTHKTHRPTIEDLRTFESDLRDEIRSSADHFRRVLLHLEEVDAHKQRAQTIARHLRDNAEHSRAFRSNMHEALCDLALAGLLGEDTLADPCPTTRRIQQTIDQSYFLHRVNKNLRRREAAA